MKRTAWLSGLVATATLAASLVAPRARALEGWMPPAVNQAGPVCTIAATSNAVSWWMARRYGWHHKITLLNGNYAYLQRADARSVPSDRMRNVAADVETPGYVFAQHPYTRVKARTLELANPREAVKAGLPVVLAVYPAASGSNWLDPSKPRGAYHAVLLVSYDGGGYRFLNSWGSAWGSGGYGYLSNAWLAAWGGQAFALTGVTAGPR